MFENSSDLGLEKWTTTATHDVDVARGKVWFGAEFQIGRNKWSDKQVNK